MIELTNELTLDQKLELIAKAVAEADGDTAKESRLINEIVDPQDALNCEGCQ
jgi:hypothetical protein